MIPFANLRIQKRWLNINSTRTTQNGVSPFPISLSLMASHFLSDPNTMLALFLMDWRGCFRWWWHFLILKEFSQARRYRRTYTSCEINNPNFSRLLEDKVRGLLSDCSGCWIGMSRNTCVDSRNEILVLSEESFLLASLSLSRDKIQASSIDV